MNDINFCSDFYLRLLFLNQLKLDTRNWAPNRFEAHITVVETGEVSRIQSDFQFYFY